MHWHFQKAAYNMPELIAIETESNRMGGARKDNELTIWHRKLLKKIKQILFSGDAVVFARGR